MVETESITTRIEVNADGVKTGVDTAKKNLGDFEKGAESTATKIEGSTKKMSKGFADLGVSMATLATGAFSLYQTYDDIEKKEYALEKSKQGVEKATQRANDAQVKYNEAVAKFGAQSPEALAAYEDLQIANEDVALAEEKADIAQGNLNDQMTKAALVTVPALVTTSKGLVDVWKQFQGIDFKKTFASLREGLQSLGTKNAGVMGAAISAAGAFAMIYMAFTTESPKLRIAFSLIAGALIAAAAAQWIFNAAFAAGIVLTTGGAALALVAVAAGSAAAVYALSSMYGADADKYGGDARTSLDNPGAMTAGGASTASTTSGERKIIGYDANGNPVYDRSAQSVTGAYDTGSGGPEYFKDLNTGKRMYRNEYVDEAAGVYKYDTAKYGALAGDAYEKAARENQIARGYQAGYSRDMMTEMGRQEGWLGNNQAIGSNGQIINIYVDGAADAQRTADAISKTLQTQGGMGY